MTSSIPKPPRRIRVEMPAEIVPQPVPEQLLTTESKPEEIIAVTDKPVSNKIHVIHPKKVEEKPKPEEALEVEAAIATSVETPVPVEETPAAETTNRNEAEAQQANALPTVISVPPDAELFTKQYYTIGEVADMFGANQSQIRFWENEFEILQPKKNKKGDRYFRPEDVKNLVLIRHLLQERRFTIEGAKEYLKGKAKRLADRHQAIQQLEKLKGFLLEMKANLGEQV